MHCLETLARLNAKAGFDAESFMEFEQRAAVAKVSGAIWVHFKGRVYSLVEADRLIAFAAAQFHP